MELLLEKLSIRNFKGIREFDFEPGGENVTILGDNATGKSTVYDAYCWLLFGTDSNGSSAFDIEPRDENGAVADTEAVTEVTGEFLADGKDIEFRKRNMQKWTRVRGRSELTYQGNANEYEVNNVPCTKCEYEEKISALCDPKLLKILSNVFAFTSMDWLEQRTALTDMAGDVDDFTVMAEEGEKYKGLLELMYETNSELYKVVKMIERDRKLAVQAQNALPAAIDENKRYLGGNTSPLQNNDLKEKAAKLQHEIDVLNQCRADALSDVQIIASRDILAAADADIAALKRQNELYIREQRNLYDMANSLQKLKREAKDAEERRIAEERRVEACKRDADQLGDRVKTLRLEYEAEMSKPYKGEDTCPRCGRKYDDAMIANARQIFENEKNARLGELAAQGKSAKSNYEAAQEELAEAFRRLKEAGNAEDAARKKLGGIAEFKPTDMEGYAKKLSELEKNRDDCEKELNCLKTSRDDRFKDIDAEKTHKQNELAEINRKIGDAERYYTVKERLIELEKELKHNGELVNRYDALLALADDYGMYKARRIEDGINELFHMVRFKLFENQKNGGLRFCCEATVDGIGFNKNLNTSAKINAGMDIINAFSEKYGVHAPVFIDNTESVTDLVCVESQMVRLRVAPGKDKLEMVFE